MPSLPNRLARALDAALAASRSWAVPVAEDTLRRWMIQFDPDDYPLAALIVKNLKVFGSDQVREGLRAAHTRIERAAAEAGSPITPRNTVYAGMGAAAKSGGLISYHLRVVAELPESNFINDADEDDYDVDVVDNYVLVDDVIGTRRTAKRSVDEFSAEVLSLNPKANIFVLVAAGYRAGRMLVADSAAREVVCGWELDDEDTVISFDCPFYDGLTASQRQATLDRIKYYNRKISSSELGYGGVGGLLAFEYNTPNTTLPVVSQRAKGWQPLFARAGRVPGLHRYRKRLEETRRDAPQRASPPPQPSANTTLTMIVEGKSDEHFVRSLAAHHDLANRLGVAAISTIAMGGLVPMQRFLNLLQMMAKPAIAVVDGDEHTRKAMAQGASGGAIPVVMLHPNFMGLLNLARLIEDLEPVQQLTLDLGTAPLEPEKEEHIYMELEKMLLRQRGRSAFIVDIDFLVTKYLDDDRYNAFVNELCKALKDQLEAPDRRGTE